MGIVLRETAADRIMKQAIADPNSPKTKSILRSSNLSYFTAVWSIAKTCTDLIALQKRLYPAPGSHAPSVGMIGKDN